MLQAAEGYYVEAGDWDSAVNMYRGNNNWEEAYNCARDNGGVPAGNKVAYAWALTLGGEAGSKLLTRLVSGFLGRCALLLFWLCLLSPHAHVCRTVFAPSCTRSHVVRGRPCGGDVVDW